MPAQRDCVWADADFSLDFLSEVIEHVGFPVFVKDRRFRYVLVNRALNGLLSLPREHILGRTDLELFHEGEAARFRQEDLELFASGKPLVIEYVPLRDADGVLHYLAAKKVPLCNAHGEVTHIVGIVYDVTRLKSAEDALQRANDELERRVMERTEELAQAQAELVRKERLAVLGQLAGGLAHQLRNPLASIKNAAYIIQKHLTDDASAPVVQALAMIHEDIQSADDTITSLLNYARMRPPMTRRVPIGYLVDQLLSAQPLPGNVVVSKQLQETPPLYIDVDIEQVHGALGNLLRNALDAMPQGGELVISAEREGSMAVLSIADSGSGIARQIRHRLFEPLVTTKPIGVGLGLVTAKNLIEQQGGSLTVSSFEHPTRFDVRLPVQRPPSAPA
jgi:PAS domain S-box-containing protein